MCKRDYQDSNSRLPRMDRMHYLFGRLLDAPPPENNLFDCGIILAILHVSSFRFHSAAFTGFFTFLLRVALRWRYLHFVTSSEREVILPICILSVVQVYNLNSFLVSGRCSGDCWGRWSINVSSPFHPCEHAYEPTAGISSRSSAQGEMLVISADSTLVVVCLRFRIYKVNGNWVGSFWVSGPWERRSFRTFRPKEVPSYETAW